MRLNDNELQLRKYKMGCFQYRIDLIMDMFNRHKPCEDPYILDLACNIGTFANEFKKLGYGVGGVDIDKEAIDIAYSLWGGDYFNEDILRPGIILTAHVIILADILEHLTDDELGLLFYQIDRQLTDNGVVIFHTKPKENDHIRRRLKLSEKWVRILGKIIDSVLILFTGRDYAERISDTVHPNPLTVKRLEGILGRHGFYLAEVNEDYRAIWGVIKRR